MNDFRFEAEIVRGDGVPAGGVRRRVYGGVRVTADWPENRATSELRVPVTVSGDVDRLDAPAYVELFFHDVFLLLNLSVPGSFSGTVSVTGGDLRIRELTFSARVFEYARGLEGLPLEAVAAWYDGLCLGTQQIATNAASVVLFQLLQLARHEENEEDSILRLASAAEALVGRPEPFRRLFALRDAIARGRTPVLHPMHDDALDPRVEDVNAEWIEVIDAAANTILAALRRVIQSAAERRSTR